MTGLLKDAIITAELAKFITDSNNTIPKFFRLNQRWGPTNISISQFEMSHTAPGGTGYAEQAL